MPAETSAWFRCGGTLSTTPCTCCVTTIYSKKEPAFYLVIHFFLFPHESPMCVPLAHGFRFYFPSISSRESLARHTGAESVKKIPMTIIQTSKSPPEIMPNGIPNHNLIILVRFWLKKLDRSLTSILRHYKHFNHQMKARAHLTVSKTKGAIQETK